MSTSRGICLHLIWIAALSAYAPAIDTALASRRYDLARTDGMNCFEGSADAKELLAKQGFVVAAPAFNQIFQAYVESPLPVFVTPDSAWHTNHVVFEEAVKEMERAQSCRLAEFSKRLLDAAQAHSSVGAEFEAIAAYASIGLAFQDKVYREGLPASQKELVNNLLNGSMPVLVPIGFPLSPLQFRPQSFYAESADLVEFYSAHRWYANIDFRLSNERETTLALCLGWLIDKDPELLGLWEQLTRPYELFVAPTEDGTVQMYNRAAREVLASDFGPPGFRSRLASIQTRLDSLVPSPRINDQYLSPNEYAQFPHVTKGFRLLPDRQLPCQICFQNTVYPNIPGRMFPSGLDFMAASPVMRSPAAVRAVEAQFGKSAATVIEKAECPAMPDSLYGQSMELLAFLQERLPPRVPECLRTEAWADLQLWTQLAAWSEQRHTWALYAKSGAAYAGDTTPPPGVVAPYPHFFSGLAKLARNSARAFEISARLILPPKAAAGEILESEMLIRSNYNGVKPEDLAGTKEKTSHYSWFLECYSRAHPLETNWSRLRDDLAEDMKRIAAGGEPTAADADTLKLYHDTSLRSVDSLNGFAEFCGRLAHFAQKELDGKSLDRDEANWLRDYGKVMAAFCAGDWHVPFDDFSLISRIFDNPLERSVLYAGVARPQALYVVLPYKGKLQLYRGAVLSYREFVRPEAELLNDKLWQTMVKEGKAPPPPLFTRSFLRTEQPEANHKDPDLAAVSPLKPGQPGRIRLEVKEVSLGESPKEWVWHEGWITPSEDCRHVAYRARSGKKWRIFRDGIPGKEYDEAHYQRFSPDSKHLAYLAKENGQWRVVLDGTEGKPCLRIVETTKQYWPFEFSPDSKRLAYIARVEKGKQGVVVDGNLGPLFDEVLNHSFSFSENSRHFAYAGRRGRHGIVVKDDKEISQVEEVLSPVQAFGDSRIGDTFGPFLSPDGSRLAYAIRRSGKWSLVLDGVESQAWDSISYLDLDGEAAGFSPDGRHFTYVGERGDKHSVVVDEKENPDSWFYCAVFSPDSRRCAFIRTSEKPGRGFVTALVLDGVAGKEFSGEIKRPTFSPDGKQLAYKVRESLGSEFVVIHGGEEFDDYYAGGEIFFSPDNRHMAFLGHKYGRSFFVIDGQEYLKSDNPREDIRADYFTFSPDSKQWGYIGHQNKDSYAVISGAMYGPYEYLSVPEEEAYIYFSPDSRHFAFMANRDYAKSNYRGGPNFLVVDGHEYELQGAAWLSGSVLRFDSPTKLHGLIMGKDRISRLEAEIRKY